MDLIQITCIGTTNEHMVMGYDVHQTGRQKIKNDPLMNMIVHKFDVNLIPINQVDVAGNA